MDCNTAAAQPPASRVLATICCAVLLTGTCLAAAGVPTVAKGSLVADVEAALADSASSGGPTVWVNLTYFRTPNCSDTPVRTYSCEARTCCQALDSM